MHDATIEVRIADLGWPVISPLISAVSSHWSNHCDLLTDGGQMISAMPGGVRERPVESLPAKRATVLSLPCTQAQRAMALAFARHQVGKPYDYGAVLSFGWGSPWHDPAKWFCSELTAAALVAANIVTVPAVRRVSPGDLFRLLGQPAFGGVDGRQAVMIPDDVAMIGKSWADLAATKSEEHPFGLLKDARPETASEKKAREKAEAETKAAEEAAAKAQAEAEEKARITGLAVSDVQFGLACVGASIITAEEAEAWVAAGVIPANLAAAIETLPPKQRTVARIKAAGEKTFERSSPFVAILGAALGMTSEQLDGLFIAASAL